ncbi:hypothetical protein D3C86_782320 [compost metagenome]
MRQGVARRVRTRHRQKHEGARRIGRDRAVDQDTDVLAIGRRARQGDGHARDTGLARVTNAGVVIVDIDIAAEALAAGAEVIVGRRRARGDADGGHGRVGRARRRRIGAALASRASARAADEGARVGQTSRRGDGQSIVARTQHLTQRRGMARNRELVLARRSRGDRAVDRLPQIVGSGQAHDGAGQTRRLARIAGGVGVRVQEDHAAERRGRQFAEVALGQVRPRRQGADVEAFGRRTTAGVGDDRRTIGVLAVRCAVRLDQLRHRIGRAVRRRDRSEVIAARAVHVSRQVDRTAGVVRARQTDVRRRGEGRVCKARLAAACTQAVVVQVAINVTRDLGRADFLEDIARRRRGRGQDDVGNRIGLLAAAIGRVVDGPTRRPCGFVAVEGRPRLGLDDLIGPRRQAVEEEGAARHRIRRAARDGVAIHVPPAQGQGDADHAFTRVDHIVAVVVAIDPARDRGLRDLSGLGLGVVAAVRVAADFLVRGVPTRRDAGRIDQVGVQRARKGMRRLGEQGQGHGVARARREVAVQNAEDAAGPGTVHRRDGGRAADAEGLAAQHGLPAAGQGVGDAHLGRRGHAVVANDDAVLDRLVDLDRRLRDAGLADDLQIGRGNDRRGLHRRVVGQLAVRLTDGRVVLLQRHDLSAVGDGDGSGGRGARDGHAQAEDHLTELVQIVLGRVAGVQTAFDRAAHRDAVRRGRRIERQAAVRADRVHREAGQGHRIAGRRSRNVGDDHIARARRAKVGGAQVIDQLRTERHRVEIRARLFLGDRQVHGRRDHGVRQVDLVVGPVRLQRGSGHRGRVEVVDREARRRPAEREARPDLLADLIGLTAADRAHGAADLAGRVVIVADHPALGSRRLADQFEARRIDDVLDLHIRSRVRPQAAHADVVGRQHADLGRVRRNRLGVQRDVGDRRDVVAGGRRIVRQIELGRVRRGHLCRIIEEPALDRTADADHRRLELARREVVHGPADAAVAARIGRRALAGVLDREAGGEAVAGVIDEVGQVVGDDHGARRVAAQVADGESQIEDGVAGGDRKGRRLGPGTGGAEADFLDDGQVGLVRRRARDGRGAVVAAGEVDRQGAGRRTGCIGQVQVRPGPRQGLERQNHIGADRQASRPGQLAGDLDARPRTGPRQIGRDIGLVGRHRIDDAKRIGRVIGQRRRPEISDRDRAGHDLAGLDRIRPLGLADAQISVGLDNAVAGVVGVVVRDRIRDPGRRGHRGGIDHAAGGGGDRLDRNDEGLVLAGRQGAGRAGHGLPRNAAARRQGRQNFKLGRDLIDDDGAVDRQRPGVADRQGDVDRVVLDNGGRHGLLRRQVGAGLDRGDHRRSDVVARLRVQHQRARQSDEGVVGDGAASGQHPALHRDRRQIADQGRACIITGDRQAAATAVPVAARRRNELEIAGGRQVVRHADRRRSVRPGVFGLQGVGQDPAGGDGIVRLAIILGHRHVCAFAHRR